MTVSLYPDQLSAAFLGKACIKCHLSLPFEFFYMRKDSGLRRNQCNNCIKTRAKKWHFGNREQSLKNKRNWALSHPEKIKEMGRSWRAANRDKANAFGRAYRVKNGDKLRAWFREYSIRWCRKNPDKVATYRTNRRALARRVPKWADLWQMDNFYLSAITLGLTVDHIVPLNSKIVCGLHCDTNLALMDGRENTSKGNRRWPDMP